MNFKISAKKKKTIKRIYKITLVFIGIVIVVFNDTFGKLEGFAEFIAFYFIVIFITISYWLFIQIKSIIRLKNEKTQTELMHLKSQVNPHFFFNTLNNLYGLVGTDAKKAQELILKLSDMMRYSIYEGEKEVVTLKTEVEYLNNFIALHRMRYRKEIDVRFEVEIEDDYEVMPLLFIILFENAFKHGVENLSKDAYVYSKLIAKDNNIIFEIENNFDQSIPKENKGIGLKNLKRRLALVYPKKHNLSFSTKENVYKARLTLEL